MKKLSEKQFVSILDKVVYQHNKIAQNHQKIDYDLLNPFDWMTQSFCQILWKLTESHDKNLKEKLKIAVGYIISNKAYTPRVISTEMLTFEQFSELLSEMLKMYESNDFRHYQNANMNAMLDNCAQYLCEILVEFLPGENVKNSIKIDFSVG